MINLKFYQSIDSYKLKRLLDDLTSMRIFYIMFLFFGGVKWQCKFGFDLVLFITVTCFIMINIFHPSFVKFLKINKRKLLMLSYTFFLSIVSCFVLLIFNIYFIVSKKNLKNNELILEENTNFLICIIFLLQPLRSKWLKLLYFTIFQVNALLISTIFSDGMDRYLLEDYLVLIAFIIMISNEIRKHIKDSDKSADFYYKLAKIIIENNQSGPIVLVGVTRNPIGSINKKAITLICNNSASRKLLIGNESIEFNCKIIPALKKIKDIGKSPVPNSLLQALIQHADIEGKANGSGWLERDPLEMVSESQSNKIYLNMELKKIEEPTFSCEFDFAVLMTFTTVDYKKNSFNIHNPNQREMINHFSHQLRTPLNIVSGLLESSCKTLSKHSVERPILKLALRSARRLDYAINDLIDMSLINSDNLLIDFKLELVKISSVFRQVTKIMKSHTREKGVNLDFRNELEDDHPILADWKRLTQIIINIVWVFFSRCSSNSIIISAKLDSTKSFAEPAPQRSVKKILTNNDGIAINSVVKAKSAIIISVETEGKFQLVPGDTSLHIIKELAKQFPQGENCFSINQDPVENHTSFYLKLDTISDLSSVRNFVSKNEFETGYALPVRNFIVKSKPSFNHQKIFHVLLVDDDPLNILVLKLYLNSFEIFSYDVANNGAEALELFVKSNNEKINIQENIDIKDPEKNDGVIPYDLIIMDYNMPVMNGLESAASIKSLVASGLAKYAPVVALTANAGSQIEEECMSAGMNYFLTKPLHREVFKVKLEEILGVEIKR